MNILLVSSYLPYPLYSGGHIRLYNLIKRLSKKHHITLICEQRSYQTKKHIQEVEKFCTKLITITRKKQWSLTNIVKTGFSSQSFLITGHTLPEMKEFILRELSRQSFDLIHAETFYIMQNIPETTIPLVLAEHNIEYLVYKRYAANFSALARPLLEIDILKIKKYEEACWKRATKLVAVSQVDKEIMGRQDVQIVPNGVDLKKFQISNIKFQMSNKEKRVLFIGDFQWLQNKDAVKWILKDIWPTLNSELRTQNLEQNIKLWIVGKNIPSSIKKLTHDQSVIFDENAPKETEKIYQQADVLLAPIRVGGGTQYKILEAMASGVPVITTPLGIAGLEVKPQKEVLVANSVEEFVEKLQEIVENKKLREELVQNARRAIEKYYDWDKITEKLDEVYEAVKSTNDESRETRDYRR